MVSNKRVSSQELFEVDTKGTAVDLQSLGIDRDAVYEPQPTEGEAKPRFRRPVNGSQRRVTEPGVRNFRPEED